MCDTPGSAAPTGRTYDLADVFDQIPVGVAIFDISDAFRCLRSNQRFSDTIGASGRTSICGSALSDLLAPESYLPTRAIFEQVRAEGVPFASDHYAARIKWELAPRYFQWRLTPLRGPDGAICALLSSGGEVSAPKQPEAEALAASQSHALLDTLIRVAPVGVAFFDLELRFVRINERMAELNGLPVAEHIGRRLSDLVPILGATVEPLMRQVISTGEAVLNLEASPQSVYPGSAWLKSFYPVPDASGAIIGVGVIVIDVGDERRMQQELNEVTQRERERAADLVALLQAVPAAVWIAHDADCRVITGSRAASGMLRMSPESNLSKTASDEAAPTHFRVFAQGVELAPEDLPVQQAARGIEVHDFEEDVVFEDGTTRTLLGNATPLRDERGELRGAVAAFLDITERKHAEEERARLYAAEQQARAEAEAALKIRDTFFSMAAHELKTPLTTLLGQVQLIERRTARSGALDARDQRALGAVVTQAARLNKLINAMLDLTRIERGYLLLERTRIDVALIARQVLDEIQPNYPTHHFRWQGPETPAYVLGDALRLGQVFYNLIENAVKYSPRGGEVRVDIDVVGEAVRISVCDQGIGISDAALPHLFERFFRADTASAHHIDGMGIGLYIVHEIVTQHGGDLSVASVEGEGSRFVVTLTAMSE